MIWFSLRPCVERLKGAGARTGFSICAADYLLMLRGIGGRIPDCIGGPVCYAGYNCPGGDRYGEDLQLYRWPMGAAQHR
jgi:hypothetical protein